MDAPHELPLLDLLGERFGMLSARAAFVPVLLAAAPSTLAGLVVETGLSRRTVEAVLDLLGPLVLRDGDLLRLDGVPDGVAAHVRPRPTPRPWSAAHLATITGWVEAAPAARRDLDHIAATPDTAYRRARWLDDHYDLATTPLLVVGDHDLTALAVAIVNPAARALVVDIDEDLLAHVDRTAAAHGFDIGCRYADLRFALPPDVVGTAGVAFTDPPYTPEGVGLFAAQALRGLGDREYGHVVVSYGCGDGQPALGLKVQQALADLGLYVEAMEPQFNRYVGAQAVGSRSDLYVCRPTSRTWRRLDSRAGERTNIYTHGAQSLEAGVPRLSDTAAAQVLADAGDVAGVVGDRWPDGPPSVRQATFFDGGVPPAIRNRPGTLVLDLAADPGPWLLRALLIATAARIDAVVPTGHPDLSGLDRYVGVKYRLDVRRNHPVRGFATMTATAVPTDDLGPAARLQRHVLDRAQGSLASVWRDGLTRHGGAATKNDARAAVGEAMIGLTPRAARLADMPRHQVAEILDRIGGSARAVTRP